MPCLVSSVQCVRVAEYFCLYFQFQFLSRAEEQPSSKDVCAKAQGGVGVVVILFRDFFFLQNKGLIDVLVHMLVNVQIFSLSRKICLLCLICVFVFSKPLRSSSIFCIFLLFKLPYIESLKYSSKNGHMHLRSRHFLTVLR